MTIQKISKNIFYEFRKKFSKGEKRWVPSRFDEYFYVDNDNTIEVEDWIGCNKDLFRLNQGNVFRNSKEAINHRKKLNTIAVVVNYCWDKGLAKEWEIGQNNYYIYLDGEDKELDYSINYTCKSLMILPYLISRDACEQLMKEKKKELKIIFEVNN